MCYIEEYLSRSDDDDKKTIENIKEEIGDLDDFIFADEIIKYESER